MAGSSENGDGADGDGGVADAGFGWAAASARSPATTRIWKAEERDELDSVTISVVDQPASSSACSAAGAGVARAEDQQMRVLERGGERGRGRPARCAPTR